MKNIFATMSGICAGGILIAMGVAIGYSAQNPEEANEIARINSMMPAPLPQATKSMPQATKTIQLPGATITAPPKVITKVITKKVPSRVLTCPSGKTEDSCYPDYIGKGRWVLRVGERPMPKATKSLPKASTHKVPGATIAGVCRHPSITKGMLADCNKLASRPAISVPGKYAHPNGRVLVKECTDQYKGEELAICLR